MKPFYGIDRTVLKKSQYHEGDCFIAASLSGSAGDALTRAAEQTAEVEKRAKLPAPLNFIQKAAGILAALLFVGIIRGLRSVDITQAYANAPELFWTLGISAAIWAVLSLIGSSIQKKVKATEESCVVEKRLETAIDSAFRDLGVPPNAKDVDVVCLRHRWKNGKLKIHTQGMEMSAYSNESFKVFVHDGKLCLANLENRYEIDLKELRCLRSVRKPIIPTGWNKEEAPTEGFYKPYRLTVDQYQRIHMRSYGLLELEHEGESWAIWLPPYELNYISALTGLAITE